MTSYIVHRATVPGGVSNVSDRASGRLLGYVAQHLPHDGAYSGMWTVWAPWKSWGNALVANWDEGLGDAPAETRDEAIALLYDPQALEPPVLRQRCPACVPKLWGQPCPRCETQEAATARERQEHPDWWEHYDWLVLWNQEHPQELP